MELIKIRPFFCLYIMYKAEVCIKGGKKLKAIGYFQNIQSVIRLFSNIDSFQKNAKRKAGIFKRS